MESSFTLEEYLQRTTTQVEEEARRQQEQGWGDEDVCTHPSGYSRQPVFACLSCQQKSGREFGVCFGCSMTCHVGHDDIIELYDKRGFRCDCGTPRSGCACTMQQPDEDRTADNAENQYGHNFQGFFCWCNGKYEAETDTMYQCVCCMDWFHKQCVQQRDPLQANVSAENANCDFICSDCSSKLWPVLQHYAKVACIPPADFTHAPAHLWSRLAVAEGLEVQCDNCNKTLAPLETERYRCVTCPDMDLCAPCFEKSGWALSSEPLAAELPKPNEECPREQQPADLPEGVASGKCLHIRTGWRELLCKCEECVAVYLSLQASYLIDDADWAMDARTGLNQSQDDAAPADAQPQEDPKNSLAGAGAQSGPANNNGQPSPTAPPPAHPAPAAIPTFEALEDAALTRLLSNLAPTQSIEMMEAFNEMKQELLVYLCNLPRDRPVRSQDIQDFFGEFRLRKRLRRE